MKCGRDDCTGSHDLRKREQMCPRTRADERARHERWKVANPAAYMLSQVNYDARRREQREAAK